MCDGHLCLLNGIRRKYIVDSQCCSGMQRKVCSLHLGVKGVCKNFGMRMQVHGQLTCINQTTSWLTQILE